MIIVDIKPRQDDLYDMYVRDDGDHFVSSNQGYANVEDVEALARRMWPPIDLPHAPELKWSVDLGEGMFDIPNTHIEGVLQLLRSNAEAVVMRVTYRNGKSKTERLR